MSGYAVRRLAVFFFFSLAFNYSSRRFHFFGQHVPPVRRARSFCCSSSAIFSFLCSCKLICGSIFRMLTRPGLFISFHGSFSRTIRYAVVLHLYRETNMPTIPKYVDCMQSLVLCMHTKKLCAYKYHALFKLSDNPDMRHGHCI